jgi:alpha-methylacyl-CoA racemase
MIRGHRRIDPVARGRRLVEADLKDAGGRERVLALTDRADVVTEGFRPGVTERLGVGPACAWSATPARVRAGHRMRAGRPLRPGAGARH